MAPRQVKHTPFIVDYSDLYILAQIKKLQATVEMINSHLGIIISQVGGQIYDGTVDPVSSGFLPQNIAKPAIFNLYEADGTPIAARTWNVAKQLWK